MKNLEIEKKYLVKKTDLPKNLKQYKHVNIVQSFICLSPCIRIRKAGNQFFLTVKSKPIIKKNTRDIEKDLIRAEYEIEINKKTYDKLLRLTSGKIIEKTRYFIPYKKYTIELDIFSGTFKGLIYAEVEFKNVKSAKSFIPPVWFYKDVTGIEKYKNTRLSICNDVEKLIKY